jgi:hypothetical protein
MASWSCPDRTYFLERRDEIMSDSVIGYRQFKDCKIMVTSWGAGNRGIGIMIFNAEDNHMLSRYRLLFDRNLELYEVAAQDKMTEITEVLMERQPAPPEPPPPSPFRSFEKRAGRFVVSEGSTGEWSKNLSPEFPRCRSCKHYRKTHDSNVSTSSGKFTDESGECLAAFITFGDPGDPRKYTSDDEGYPATLNVKASFGCVDHEYK